jgi:glycosyltransferase involved in cell wall biosynthesis
MKGPSESKKIRVFHVITRFDKGGSAENTFLTLMGLDGKKYDLTLIYGSSADSGTSPEESKAIEKNIEKIKEKGVKVIPISSLVRPISPLRDFLAFLTLYKLFRRGKPLIVHTHTSKAGILGRWTAFFARVPIIIHTPHGHVFWGYFGKFTTGIFIILERLTAHITHRLIMLTPAERDDHLNFRIAPEEKFSIIHSGVDLSPFSHITAATGKQMRESLSIGEREFVIGTVGRLTAIKGHKYLLGAFALYLERGGEGQVIILGEGELRATLEKQADELGISHKLHFLGWRAEVAQIMSTFDIFVFPSLNEGMGKVIVEAMACGLPIIASRVGGIKDLIVHGEDGWLVPPAEEESLAQALMMMYRDQNLRSNLGKRAKEKAMLYSKQAMIKKIEALYHREIEARHVK